MTNRKKELKQLIQQQKLDRDPWDSKKIVYQSHYPNDMWSGYFEDKWQDYLDLAEYKQEREEKLEKLQVILKNYYSAWSNRIRVQNTRTRKKAQNENRELKPGEKMTIERNKKKLTIFRLHFFGDKLSKRQIAIALKIKPHTCAKYLEEITDEIILVYKQGHHK